MVSTWDKDVSFGQTRCRQFIASLYLRLKLLPSGTKWIARRLLQRWPTSSEHQCVTCTSGAAHSEALVPVHSAGPLHRVATPVGGALGGTGQLRGFGFSTPAGGGEWDRIA